MTRQPKHISDRDGTQEWVVGHRRHREDGPACTWTDGSQEWYANGQCHRLDGPAVIYPSGEQEWWVRGENISLQVVAWMQQQSISWPWDELTQMQFALLFA